jgi:flagellin
MSISIQTNVASLSAQYYIGQNQIFQNKAIEQLSSGYKINSSADDPAGLAVANQYAGSVTELTAGVQNATDGVSTLQIADGGLSNISQILGRLQTLAAESASQTFQGSRTTVNDEYQGLLAEITRQASNIGLNAGGVNNTNLTVYTGGGATQADSQISVDLSGANNAVDATSLGIGATSVAGGGAQIGGNNIDLSNTAVSFLAGATQNFTFNLNTGTGDQAVTIAVNPTAAGAGLNGAGVVGSLNTSLAAYGITASIGSNGSLEFGGSTAFTVNTTAAGTGPISTTGNATNTSNYNIDSGAYTAITGASETDLFQNASGTTAVTFTSAVGNSDTLANAIATANTQLAGTGITAVQNAAGTGISFQSTGAFSVSQTSAPGGGQIFAPAPAVLTVNKPTVSSTDTGNALAALAALTQAISNLGLVQGTIGAGENKLQYATNLAQSQITNYSAAESGIRDADVAAAAANLTKAQVLQQTSLAALSQANSAPQAVLSLLKNLG